LRDFLLGAARFTSGFLLAALGVALLTTMLLWSPEVVRRVLDRDVRSITAASASALGAARLRGSGPGVSLEQACRGACDAVVTRDGAALVVFRALDAQERCLNCKALSRGEGR
jgi:hypothetical protein